jgi:acyl-coenzyme A thioesterase PaaI-like protein
MIHRAEADRSRLEQVRDRVHPACIVCGSENPYGLRLVLLPCPDGSVLGSFQPRASYEGYSGRLHGGILAALLDGAMTHCLFARGCAAVTADLRVRFRHPVTTDGRLIVRAWVRRTYPPLYLMAAEIIQNDQIKATAEAKFMRQNGLDA